MTDYAHLQVSTQIEAVRFKPATPDEPAAVALIDQRLLPGTEQFDRFESAETVAAAITEMVVRGAPAIGVTAAWGMVVEALALATEPPTAEDRAAFDAALDTAHEVLAASRPTAVNLFWALDRMAAVRRAQRTDATPAAIAAALRTEAQAIHDEDRQMCLQMGRHGAPLLPREGGVLTHCNTGALATGGIGTALGVIRAAHAAGHGLHVWVDETRPYLQGARLTAWECLTDGLDATLISDNAAASMMAAGRVQAAIVGSDRIAANGDVANKIGTYAVAILCRYHGIPLYVAAPTSTIDLDCPTGADIPIEQRTPREVTHIGGWAPPGSVPQLAIAPEGIAVANPAFDVVPAALVDGIITEQGVATAPFAPALATMVQQADAARRG